MDLFISVGLLIVLTAVIFFDLRQMRIPNYLSFVLLALFAVLAFTLQPTEIGIRAAQAAIIFTFGFFAFMFHLIGGGDVKILSALALFVPFEYVPNLMLVFSVTLLMGTCIILFCRRFFKTTQDGWAFLKTPKMPMGLPIGLAGIIAVAAPAIS